MTDDRASIRRIAWREVCPWLIIFRCFSLSVSLPVLFLATFGTLLTPVGWKVGESLFAEQASERGVFVTVAELGERQRVLWRGGTDEEILARVGQVLSTNVTGVFRQFVDPFAHLVVNRNRLTVRETAYYLWGGLWNILVWAFVAGAITRLAAVQLGREERIGLREAMGYVGRRYLWYVLSPLFPTVFIAMVCVPLVLLGALMKFDLGVLIAGLAWFLVLIGGFIVTMVMLGLSVGWPLMWPAISSEEGSDAYDAYSRSYSYTFQRPLHYLFFAGVTVVFGALCWVLVSVFSSFVVESAYWGVSLGAGARISEIQDLPSKDTVVFAGAFLIRVCVILVQTIAVAFNQGFFWCAATAIYLLLRREVDETELDEIYMEEEESRFALPELVTPQGDQAGESAPSENTGVENSA